MIDLNQNRPKSTVTVGKILECYPNTKLFLHIALYSAAEQIAKDIAYSFVTSCNPKEMRIQCSGVIWGYVYHYFFTQTLAYSLWFLEPGSIVHLFPASVLGMRYDTFVALSKEYWKKFDSQDSVTYEEFFAVYKEKR